MNKLKVYKKIFFYSFVWTIMLFSCSEDDHSNPNGIEETTEDNIDSSSDTDGNTSTLHAENFLFEWDGDLLASSNCNQQGEYTMTLNLNSWDQNNQSLSGTLKIENKWLYNDFVFFQVNATLEDEKLIVQTIQISEYNQRMCHWCQGNTFSFQLEDDCLNGNWIAAHCDDSGYNEDNSIELYKSE